MSQPILYKSIKGWFSWEALYRLMVMKAPIDQPSVFVELGVFYGRSSIYLAELIKASGKPIILYSVDIWQYYISTDMTYAEFVRNAIKFPGIVMPIRRSSVEFAKELENDSVDGVFVDADHRYEWVKADMEAWIPKLKNGGILAGHDYTDDFPGVIKAVTEQFKDTHKIWKDCWVKTIWK